MNTLARYGIPAFLVIAILFTLVHVISTPQIYSAKNDTFSTLFHDNVDVLKSQPQNSTTDIDPLLQDFIDNPGSISLEIQINDAADAQRDLESFEKSRISLTNLVVKLNMNQSDIQELEDDTVQQKRILDTLLNTSITLNSLQALEIQYRDENNNDMLTTVRLQGDALRKQIQGLDQRYRNSTEKISSIATKFNLDDTKNKASQATVSQIVSTIARPEPATRIPVNTLLTPGDKRISLYLIPPTGKYRDVIACMGLSLTLKGNTTIRANGQPITIYLDDTPLSNTTTDMFGYYNIRLPIGRIAAGSHTVYARAPDVRSINQTLTVIRVDSVTNLSVSRPDGEGNVNCTGFVLANYAVPSASVQITVDNTSVTVTKTNAEGEFMRTIPLSPGTHTLIADFDGDGYPLNPSESDPITVEIALIKGVNIDYGYIALIISGTGILLASLGAAVWYLRRMGLRRLPSPGMQQENRLPSGSDDLGRREDTAEDAADQEQETLIAYYTRLLKEEGLSAASRGVYQQLAERVARDLNIRRYKALTAREISRKCREKPYCRAFARFISVYERIRYGGQISVKDQSQFETAIDATEEQMGSDDY